MGCQGGHHPVQRPPTGALFGVRVDWSATVSLRDLRHRIEDSLFVLVTRLIRVLPHRAIYHIGSAVGRGLLSFGRRRRLMRANLALVFPDRDPAERAQIARQCASRLGGIFFDRASADRFSHEEMLCRFTFEGWEHVERAQAAGKTLFLISGHFGAFDHLVLPLARRLGRVHMVVQAQTNPHTRRRMDAMRERMGVTLLPRSGGGPRMLKLLRAGETVGMAIDQRVRPWDGILVAFLGSLGWVSPMPAYLALQTGACVLPMFCTIGADGRYQARVKAPVSVDDLGDDPVVELTRRMLDPIEREIRRAPEEWFWIHDRWRLIWQHHEPQSLDRLRRQSSLPEGHEVAERDRRVADELHTLITRDRLEATGNFAVAGGSVNRRSAVAIEVARAAVESGLVVRHFDRGELADRLRAAESAGELAQELRRWDACALLVLTAAEDTQLPDDDPWTLKMLVHRRGRGSVLAALPTSALPPQWLAGASAVELETDDDRAAADFRTADSRATNPQVADAQAAGPPAASAARADS